MGIVNDIIAYGSSFFARNRGAGFTGRRIDVVGLFWGTDKRRTVFIVVIIICLAAILLFKFHLTIGYFGYVSLFILSIGLLVAYPFWGVIILLVTDILIPFYNITVPFIGLKMPFTKFFGLFVFLTFIINSAVKAKYISLGNHIQVFFLYVFLIIGVLSSFNASRTYTAELEVMRLFLLAALYLIAYNVVNDWRKALTLYNFLALAAFIVSIYAVYEALVLNIPRPTGRTGIPGDLALYSTLGFAFLLVLFLESKGIFIRLYSLIGIGITSSGLLVSNNRSGFTAFTFTLFVQLIRKRSKYVYYVPVLLIVLLLINIIPEIYTSRSSEFVSKVYERGFSAVEKEPRYALYRTGIDLFLEHPLLGVGPWNFGKLYLLGYAAKYKGRKINLIPHSGILGLLAEFGFFAFASFMGYVAATGLIFRRSARLAELFNRPRERIIILASEAMFWAFFVWGMFQDISGKRLMYVFPAIGAAMYKNLLELTKDQSATAADYIPKEVDL